MHFISVEEGSRPLPGLEGGFAPVSRAHNETVETESFNSNGPVSWPAFWREYRMFLAKLLVVLVVVIYLADQVWPTQWVTLTDNGVVYRVNRFTGQMQSARWGMWVDPNWDAPDGSPKWERPPSDE